MLGLDRGMVLDVVGVIEGYGLGSYEYYRDGAAYDGLCSIMMGERAGGVVFGCSGTLWDMFLGYALSTSEGHPHLGVIEKCMVVGDGSASLYGFSGVLAEDVRGIFRKSWPWMMVGGEYLGIGLGATEGELLGLRGSRVLVSDREFFSRYIATGTGEYRWWLLGYLLSSYMLYLAKVFSEGLKKDRVRYSALWLDFSGTVLSGIVLPAWVRGGFEAALGRVVDSAELRDGIRAVVVYGDYDEGSYQRYGSLFEDLTERLKGNRFGG